MKIKSTKFPGCSAQERDFCRYKDDRLFDKQDLECWECAAREFDFRKSGRDQFGEKL